jgi:hypothetical protein
MRTGRILGIALLLVGARRARSPDVSGFQEVQKAERAVCYLLQHPFGDVRSKGEEDTNPRSLED